MQVELCAPLFKKCIQVESYCLLRGMRLAPQFRERGLWPTGSEFPSTSSEADSQRHCQSFFFFFILVCS